MPYRERRRRIWNWICCSAAAERKPRSFRPCARTAPSTISTICSESMDSAFRMILNAESMDSEQMVEMVEGAVRAQGLKERGFLSAAAEQQIQFQIRLRLSRYGIVPPGAVRLPGKSFTHHSEQIFANLLDFYRIAWEYEPRNFPVQWDAEGRISESFTPDFYLPEFDLYIELTTMKQSLVTRKN